MAERFQYNADEWPDATRIRLRRLMSSLIALGDVAELLSLIWPDEPETQIHPRTPRVWFQRWQDGRDGAMPPPDLLTGIAERPMWYGGNLVDWYAQKNGLLRPRFISREIRRRRNDGSIPGKGYDRNSADQRVARQRKMREHAVEMTRKRLEGAGE